MLTRKDSCWLWQQQKTRKWRRCSEGLSLDLEDLMQCGTEFSCQCERGGGLCADRGKYNCSLSFIQEHVCSISPFTTAFQAITLPKHGQTPKTLIILISRNLLRRHTVTARQCECVWVKTVVTDGNTWKQTNEVVCVWGGSSILLGP